MPQKLVYTFTAGQSASNESPSLNGCLPIAVRVTGAAWTSASLSFKCDNAPLHVLDGATEYSLTVAVNTLVPCRASDFLGAEVLQLVSGTNATPVAQAANTTVEVYTISRHNAVVPTG